jgi:hypothetical protein
MAKSPPGPVAGVVGFVWRDLRKHQDIESGGEVNWLIDELRGQRLPAIDLAHVDLS